MSITEQAPATDAGNARNKAEDRAAARPRRLARLRALARPLLVALVLVAAGGALQYTEGQARHASPAADRALLDAPATTKVTGDVATAVGRVFTYTPGDTAATERAAAEVLTGRAASQYRQLFGQVRQQAPTQQIALTSRVVRIGATRLTGDAATLLVFLDQTATRAGRPAGTPAAAQLTVTARLLDGRWRITDIRSS
ncbi:hypothetical protein [Actinomadura hibisca]|uniref:hypothetical protein n=1 Tax=Actinomadura hibisca TaxID=68565 RepID=UPI000AD43E74|nr:hypothetical protein [Actinomadura hibisca]